MSDDTDDELGDFEEFGGDDDEDDEQGGRKAKRTVSTQVVEDPRDDEDADLRDVSEVYWSMVEHIPEDELGGADPREVAEAAAKVVRAGSGADNPLGLDPRVGLRDVAYDRAKPGAKVYVLDVLGETVEEYYEEFPDAPRLDEYAGNLVPGFDEDMAVFACVYLKDSLTSADTGITAYPMPEGRLTRYPAEQASMVGESEVEFARSDLPGGHEPGAVRAISKTLRAIYGENPQLPVDGVAVPEVLDVLTTAFDEETVREAVREAGYEEVA